jgi:hypothetical protein
LQEAFDRLEPVILAAAAKLPHTERSIHDEQL